MSILSWARSALGSASKGYGRVWKMGATAIETGVVKVVATCAKVKQDVVIWVYNKLSPVGPELPPDEIEKRPETLKAAATKWAYATTDLCLTAAVTCASAGTALAAAEKTIKVVKGIEKTAGWVNWIPIISSNPALAFKVFVAVLLAQLAAATWKAIKESAACRANAVSFWEATKEIKDALLAWLGFFRIGKQWRLPAPPVDPAPSNDNGDSTLPAVA